MTDMPETAGTMNVLSQYFRCPEQYARVAPSGSLSQKSGYFRFGEEVLYGQCCGAVPSDSPTDLVRSTSDSRRRGGTAYLPFDLNQIVDNLRTEVYSNWWSNGNRRSAAASLYYFFRPILPVAVRKHLQKIRLQGWEKLPFPHWPVDRTVDRVLEQALLLSMRAQNLKQIPFIWFWPHGASSCALMTHDVETSAGVKLCHELMDVNDSFGIKASFQLIPEERYEVTPAFLQSIQGRGFEVVVHDLNHDGHLFRDRDRFVERVAKINSYGKQFGATGFRAGVLYRNQLWYHLLDFEYDMSVPNVAHLDPQRGGCCTVMPYFVGNILEIPVTTTQDYTLFNILNDYSTDLWKRQANLIMEKHGLMSFIAHPDYLTRPCEMHSYKALLAHLSELRERNNVWITTPGQVNQWWRQRAKMQLVDGGHGWQIDGEGKEQARLAYASERDGRLVLELSAADVCRASTVDQSTALSKG
jgi:hypothetical protein